MSSQVPVVDLAPWFSGDDRARAAVAADVDGALESIGFFLIGGHGVADELRARVRAQARAFFALPSEVKQRYAVTVGGRGWLPQAEAPDEDLVSLIYFYEADHDAVIESLKPPIGRPNDYGPVVSAQFIKERLDAITLG
jgi:non-haem dioxygenase in morphine synthesis N-terminal